jgi:DNA invertase Pin-like site-specific DNA recombinase
MPAKSKPANSPDQAPVRAYSYQRFSTPEQAKGDSIRRQSELRDAWLKKMGMTLDTKLSLRDAGKSGFRGRHRENPDRNALAAFLQLVERGDIPRGSYLVVESLDRLTREHVQPALLLFLNLLQAGVRIVQLIPVEQVFDDKSEAMQIMMAVMELVRGHGESAVKSQRLTAVWGEKKKRAASGVVISRACPAWIEVRDGKYQLVEAKAEVVRRIFRLATDGIGARAIIRKLIADRVKPISGRGAWNVSYVRLILSARNTFGEYQPMSGEGKNRTPDGDPIPNYYPAVITEDQWHAAQGAKKLHKPGRPGRQGVNVFAGLAIDALSGSTMHMHTFRHGENGGKGYPALLSYRGQQSGEGTSFPLAILERAILSQLKELDPREILTEDKSADVLLALSGRRAELETRCEQIKTALMEDGDFASLTDVLKRVDTELKEVDAKLAVARQEAASPIAEAWGEARGLVDALDAEDSRLRLRGALRRIISGMWCVFVGKRKGKLAAIRVQFAGSDRHRDYFVSYRPEHVGYGGRRPARWEVASFASAGIGDADLRDVKQAKKLELLLLKHTAKK